jgi:hypothetical protein
METYFLYYSIDTEDGIYVFVICFLLPRPNYFIEIDPNNSRFIFSLCSVNMTCIYIA